MRFRGSSKLNYPPPQPVQPIPPFGTQHHSLGLIQCCLVPCGIIYTVAKWQLNTDWNGRHLHHLGLMTAQCVEPWRIRPSILPFQFNNVEASSLQTGMIKSESLGHAPDHWRHHDSPVNQKEGSAQPPDGLGWGGRSRTQKHEEDQVS